MTERTVTVVEDTEETVEVCDECGLADGEMVTLRPVEYTTDVDDVHLHMGCLDDMGVDVPEGMTYGEIAYEANDVLDTTSVMVLESVDVVIWLIGVVLLSGTGWAAATGSLKLAALGGLFGSIAMLLAISAGWTQAERTNDYIRNQ